MDTPTLLITGATGFLGGATLAHVIRARPDCRLVALVRASSAEEGMQRIARSLARFGTAPSRQLEILRADITDVASLDDKLLDDVTHVVHLAANTSFRSVRSVRQVNILGTMTLAHRMRRARKLLRFLHVGTAFSCGDVPSGTTLSEDDYPTSEARHLVEYTRSKAEAEMLLQDTAPELALVVARPSIVIGHSRLGCAPSASLFWFYRAADLLRRAAAPLDMRDDIVPVDYAAQALDTLLFKESLAHRCYHVSAGASGCTWHEISAAFDRHHGARPDDPYRVIEANALELERDRMPSRLGPGDEDRMLMALRLYYRFPTLTFDNTRLLAEGVCAPPRFVDYLDLCMTRPGGRSVYDQMTDDG
jgi:thioester reductase-like protein